MKINFKNKELKELVKFQEGGEMPVEETAAPAEAAQGASPEDQILQAAAQAVQTNDAQLALQVCQALVQMAGGAAQEQAPVEGEPVYKRGGQLKYYKK